MDMKVTAFFEHPGREVLGILRDCGHKPRNLGQGRFYLDMPMHSTVPGIQIIPPEVHGMNSPLEFVVKAAEPLCHLDRDGLVICGTDGRPLRPYYLPTQEQQSDLGLARFMEPELVSARVEPSQNLFLKRHMVKRVNCDIVFVEDEVLWRGSLCTLPADLRHYNGAVRAALHKATCNEVCDHPIARYIVHPNDRRNVRRR